MFYVVLCSYVPIPQLVTSPSTDPGSVITLFEKRYNTLLCIMTIFERYYYGFFALKRVLQSVSTPS